MLLGRVVQVVSEGRPAGEVLAVGDRVSTMF